MPVKRKSTASEASCRKRRTIDRDIKTNVDVGVGMYATDGPAFTYLQKTVTRWDVKWALRHAVNKPGTSISRNPIMRYDAVCIMHPSEELLDLLMPFELSQDHARFPWHKVVLRMPID
eukprot:g8023.t1